MNIRRYALWGVSLVGAVVLGWPTSTTLVAQQTITVEGWVYDSSGSPLNQVTVKAWQEGKPSGKPFDTGKDGQYKLLLTGGKAVSRIEYTRSDLDPGEVINLSGSKDHRISKILYKPGEPRPFAATVEQLAAYRHILIFTLNTPAFREELTAVIRKSDYRGKLAALPVPVEMQREVTDLLRRDKDQLVQDYQKLGL